MNTIEPTSLVIGFLNRHPPREGVSASSEVPAHRPEAFITVERTGGSVGLFRDDATMTINAYDTSAANAMDLARATVDRLGDMFFSEAAVANVKILSIYNNPETTGNRTARATINMTVTIAPTGEATRK